MHKQHISTFPTMFRLTLFIENEESLSHFKLGGPTYTTFPHLLHGCMALTVRILVVYIFVLNLLIIPRLKPTCIVTDCTKARKKNLVLIICNLKIHAGWRRCFFFLFFLAVIPILGVI